MNYRTVYKGGKGEIIEKKSRFMAEVFPVETEEETVEILGNIKKQYWDARHHCWAYIIGEDQVQERFSDDGEPGGTAGKPILEVIRGHELRNVLVVVTRYFGGTLLGTGGLVRAYTQAAQAGIAASTLITKVDGRKLKIQSDYSTLGKIQYFLAQQNISVINTEYTEIVTLTIVIPVTEESVLVNALTETVNAQVTILRDGLCCFADIDGKPVIF